mgnify:FL=1|tara:strand:- start:250 stop:498 length:249 start_codon:yes stop_codon:yes gene_type:complete
MAFERKALDKVNFDIAVEHNAQVNGEWRYGTFWADTSDEAVAKTIKKSLEESTGNKVQMSLLRATDTEPWDQYGFDITGERI